MSNINFNKIDSVFYRDRIIDQIYFKNTCVWGKNIKLFKYPFLLTNENLEVIDLDDLNFDINIATFVYIKYKKYLNFIKGQDKEKEIKDIFKNKKGGNLFKNTKDFSTQGVTWFNSDAYIKEEEKLNECNVVSIIKHWTGIGQEITLEKGKRYVFSVWAKTHRYNTSISAFLNGSGVKVVKNDWKGFSINSQWGRLTYSFVAENTTNANPRFELPDNVNEKIYFSQFMLTEGEDLYDWNDGIVSFPYEQEILSHIFDNRNDILKAVSNYVYYTPNISISMDHNILLYIHKLEKSLLKIKEYLFNKDYHKKSFNPRQYIIDKNKFQYEPMNSNPLIGYAPYGRWERSLGDIDFNLVYCDMRWKEVQDKDEDKYDWESWEKLSLYQFWKNKGKHCVFRLLLDEPSDKAHYDVPTFIYKDKTLGKIYSHEYGKGWSPYYENQKFIDKLKVFIDKLAERYGKDPFISYIQLGVVGHWGEWHVNFDNNKVRRLPKMSILKKYVDMWIGKFPYAKIMMRRPFSPCKEYGLGTYNDMIGMPSDTQDWLGWIEKGGVYDQTDETDAIVPMPDIWGKYPVGGEFTSVLTDEDMLLKNLNRTKDLINKSHHIFIGQKIPENNTKWNVQSKEISDMLGYKLFIKSVKVLPDNIEVEIENKGISRFYHGWDFDLIVHDDLGNIVETKKINKPLVEIGNEPVKLIIPIEVDAMHRYSLGIKDPMINDYAVKFSNINQKKEKIFNLI